MSIATRSARTDDPMVRGIYRMVGDVRTGHSVGGARMAADERSAVVDAGCRTFALPNLYFMSVTARAADRLLAGQQRDN